MHVPCVHPTKQLPKMYCSHEGTLLYSNVPYYTGTHSITVPSNYGFEVNARRLLIVRKIRTAGVVSKF